MQQELVHASVLRGGFFNATHVAAGVEHCEGKAAKLVAALDARQPLGTLDGAADVAHGGAEQADRNACLDLHGVVEYGLV